MRSCRLGLSDSLSELRRAIIDWKPDIVFNLLEEFDGIVTYDQHVVAFLELMHQPYTGCNPRGMLLSRDKVLSKQLLSYHRVPTPQFMVFPRGKKPRIPKKLRFPLFVKSSTEDASLGIAHASVVADQKQLDGAHRLHSRADAFGRAGGGIYRGPRAVRRRDGQRPAQGAAGVGNDVRLAAGESAGDRHPQGEVGSRAISRSTASPRRPPRTCRTARWRGSSSCRSASFARCT